MMTTPAWAGKRRDTNEKEIVEALEALGACVLRLHTPCDLFVWFRGETRLLEVKGKYGKLTAAERRFMERWPGLVVVVRSVEEALEAIGATGGW